ncbi:dihydrolipoamide acetyltransferase family protein [Oceanobacillus sp. J11TS1]|uniref:dihydrolipoamide acetyltransferase family protein n=1 Tax=Oceanobacillus sp. J11TS1 TaxID=2807191 RepID=UPI001B224C96|nr:dihydrolipoamide acetyltransferase family protein [Oceanobacillus sp. J11TS1]GIO23645.1 dihydrolipoamide acetyltransferase component of pyruvate dehydrogenase complex [Oceanobacillus sp. J11TS1]
MLEVKLHDIGEGMSEAEVISYLVREGDQVMEDQPLVEVQTDKMVAELPSPGTGKIKEIVVQTGETVSVGTTLMYIDSAVETIKNNKQNKDNSVPVLPSEKRNGESVSTIERVLATPYTRKIARDHQIDIEKVRTTDPSGRVREEDVYMYIEKNEKPNLEKQPKTDNVSTSVTNHLDFEEVPFQGIRKQIAKKMTKSLFTIPHVTHFDEVDMTNLFKLHDNLKKEDISVSVVAFFIKALTITLKDFPVFNATLDEEREKIILKKYYNIGIAADTPEGLIVPVVQDADKKSIQTIHDEVKSLTNKAQNNKLKPSDIKNSTFTVSNVGPLGSTGATPIINYPETAIIAFHKTKKMPVVTEKDEVVIRRIMSISMAFDHRVADGSSAVRFTNQFADLIENPEKLMLKMV